MRFKNILKDIIEYNKCSNNDKGQLIRLQVTLQHKTDIACV